jgi:hypothetical protein
MAQIDMLNAAATAVATVLYCMQHYFTHGPRRASPSPHSSVHRYRYGNTADRSTDEVLIKNEAFFEQMHARISQIALVTRC